MTYISVTFQKMNKPAKPLSILVVDDDADDQYFIKEAFHQYDSDAQIAALFDGQALLDLVQNNGIFKDHHDFQPDFIILDLNMPLVDGLEALQRLRKLGLLNKWPIYIISTTKSEEQISQVKQYGVRQFYTKPNNLDGYKPLVKEICDSYQTVSA